MRQLIGYLFFILYSPFINIYLNVSRIWGRNDFTAVYYKFFTDMKGEGFYDKELSEEGFILNGEAWHKDAKGWHIEVYEGMVTLSRPNMHFNTKTRNIDELKILIKQL
jgi:hypothetical protein